MARTKLAAIKVVKNGQILGYILKDSFGFGFDDWIGRRRWEVGNREESKITATSGLRGRHPQEETVWGKEQDFGFGCQVLHVDIEVEMAVKQLNIKVYSGRRSRLVTET